MHEEEVLLREGDAAFFLLASGAVGLTSPNRPERVTLAEPGQFFGELDPERAGAATTYHQPPHSTWTRRGGGKSVADTSDDLLPK